MAFERRRDGFLISDDPARLDREALCRALAELPWSVGIPREIALRALDHSLSIGLYDEAGRQIGLARFVTDRATFAYLCDVFVDPAFRGQGLGAWMVECALAHPEIAGLRRVSLVTSTAHGLYRKFGFVFPDPELYMEIHRPGIYRDGAAK